MNLLLITHGSRDPRYAASFAALCARLRRDGHRAEVGYLGLCGPDPAGAAAALAEGLAVDAVAPGRERVVAVPMFLGHGYHVTQDVPAALSTARAVLVGRAAVVAAAPLGPDPLLVEAMESRLREIGVWPGDPEVAVLMASAGSSDPGVRAAMAATAAWWARSGWHGVTPVYAAGGGPDVAEALASARAAGAAEAVVAGYFLAPGRLADRVALGAAGVPMSAPLLTPAGADPALVRLVLRRAAQALEPAVPAGGPARHRGQGRAGRAHSAQDASTRSRSAARS